jgi:hypothetical protein
MLTGMTERDWRITLDVFDAVQSVSGAPSPRLRLIDVATRQDGNLWQRRYPPASVAGGCQFHGSSACSSWFLVRPEMIRCRTSVR